MLIILLIWFVKLHKFFYWASGEYFHQQRGKVMRRKRRLFQDVVDEVTLDLESVLSSAELFSLFGLPAPAPDRE